MQYVLRIGFRELEISLPSEAPGPRGERNWYDEDDVVGLLSRYAATNPGVRVLRRVLTDDLGVAAVEMMPDAAVVRRVARAAQAGQVIATPGKQAFSSHVSKTRRTASSAAPQSDAPPPPAQSVQAVPRPTAPATRAPQVDRPDPPPPEATTAPEPEIDVEEQAETLRAAAASGAAFCEECERAA